MEKSGLFPSLVPKILNKGVKAIPDGKEKEGPLIPSFDFFAGEQKSKFLNEIEESLKSGDEERIQAELSKASMLFILGNSFVPLPDPSFFEALLPLINSENEMISQQATMLVLNLFTSFEITKENLLNPELLNELVHKISTDELFTVFMHFLEKYEDLIPQAIDLGIFDQIFPAIYNKEDPCLFKSALELMIFITKHKNEKDEFFGIEFSGEICGNIHQFITEYGPFTKPTLIYFKEVGFTVLDSLIESGDLSELIKLCVSYDISTQRVALELLIACINPQTADYLLENNILSMCNSLLCEEDYKTNKNSVLAFDILAELSRASVNCALEIIKEPISEDIVTTMNASFDFKISSLHLCCTLVDYIDNPDVQAFMNRKDYDALDQISELLTLEYDSSMSDILNVFIKLTKMKQLGTCPIIDKLNEVIETEEFKESLEAIIEFPPTSEDIEQTVALANEMLELLNE